MKGVRSLERHTVVNVVIHTRPYRTKLDDRMNGARARVIRSAAAAGRNNGLKRNKQEIS